MCHVYLYIYLPFDNRQVILNLSNNTLVYNLVIIYYLYLLMISVRLTEDNTTIACGSRDLGVWPWGETVIFKINSHTKSWMWLYKTILYKYIIYIIHTIIGLNIKISQRFTKSFLKIIKMFWRLNIIVFVDMWYSLFRFKFDLSSLKMRYVIDTIAQPLFYSTNQ
jgi:hypothetical protein